MWFFLLFPFFLADTFIEPIDGGFSNHTYLVTTDTDKYVLKIKNHSVDLQLEYQALLQASQLELAPKLYSATPDFKILLMEYLPGPTARWVDTHNKETCKQVAIALKKLHTIPYQPCFEAEPVVPFCERLYELLLDAPIIDPGIHQVMQVIYACQAELDTLLIEKRFIHGELNPRNILITPLGIRFVDWEFAAWDDPYIDLSYFSLFNDYDPELEYLLLETYLGHPPDTSELTHFHLQKKLNLAQLCLVFYRLAFKMGNNFQTPTQDFSYYLNQFAEKENDHEAAQLFYNLAQCIPKKLSKI